MRSLGKGGRTPISGIVAAAFSSAPAAGTPLRRVRAAASSSVRMERRLTARLSCIVPVWQPLEV